MRNWIALPLTGIFLVGILVIGASLANAQSSAMPPMEGMHALPPPEQLPVPIRMTGIGNSHITIKATPEAQIWFDQGLTLLHDFWDYESAKAFEQAIRVDPDCAMCYWGLDQAESMRGGAEEAYGRQALDQAVRLEGKASKTDRLYIEAARAQDRSPIPHQRIAPGDETVAIYRKLVKKEPHDAEARIFLANALGEGFDDQGEPRPGTKEKIAILEAVLKDYPNDPAANHYWIHAMEPSAHPERAIPSAALLASLAPTSGHMVHMPGHIYYRVGDYSSADRWFAASTAADEKYMRDQHVSVDDDWNYVHNLMYGIANLMEQGRLDDANALSDHLAGARGELSATLYIWSARDQVSRVSRRLPVALRTGDWTSVLAMLDQATLADNDKTTNLRFLKDELRDYASGMQALDRGNLAAAQMASAQLDAGLWRRSQDARDTTEAKAKADAGEGRSRQNRRGEKAAHRAGESGCRARTIGERTRHRVAGAARGRVAAPGQDRSGQENVRRGHRRGKEARLSRAAVLHSPRGGDGSRSAAAREGLRRRKNGLPGRAGGAPCLRLRTLRHRARR